MNTIWRNLLSVLRRFKMATLLNVLGLSVAFAAFMMIMMQVDYDRSFDQFHTEASSIFRVDYKYDGGTQAVMARPFCHIFIESSPHIKAGALMNMGKFKNTVFFSVQKEGVDRKYEERMTEVSPEFTQVFDFTMLEGNASCMKDPRSLLIPASIAEKLFGDESAVGKQLTLPEQGGFFTVGGVYRDFPLNSSVHNIMYGSINPKENIDQWGNWNYNLYVRLDSPENMEDVVANFKKNPTILETMGGKSWEENKVDLQLTSLPELHYLTNVAYDTTPKASRSTLLVLFTIAFVILVIAGINFMNFSTALTPMRIKSINTQKVLGSPDNLLRAGLLVEAAAISLLAYILSVGMLHLVSLSSLAGLVDANISLSQHPLLLAGTALLALLIGLLSGVYPAYYITSFSPALVLKGSFGLSPKGRQLRNVLIGIQFIASFTLIIGSIFMYMQNYYMQHAPLGYDKEALIVTNLNSKMNKNLNAFTNQLKANSMIDDVTHSETLLSSGDTYMGWGRSYNDKSIQFQCIPVAASFLKVMGVEVTEGRNFRPEDELTANGVYIFNERARSEYEMKLNETIDGSEIVGFMPDVKFASFRTAVSPMAFFVWGEERWGGRERWQNYTYVKVKAKSDLRAAMDHVRSTMRAFDSEYPFDIRFYDDVLNRTYEKEQKISSQIMLFSLVAVFISIVGVFGLVVFDSEYRKKEIGVRRVLGSSIAEILIMFNKTYLAILLICFVPAAPIAWYAVDRWLENFAYRTPMYAWVFAVSFLLVAGITILTITFQNWRAANENPVNSLKNE